MRPHLRATRLRVAYGAVPALRDVDLDLHGGTFLAVVGPSGAGKTTLLWALAGALEADRCTVTGTVALDDVPVLDRTASAAAGVAVVVQGNGLVSTLTGRENVLAPLHAAGVPPDRARERTEAALARVGLDAVGHHLVEELSGGQQQRLGLARALAAEPRVLLADEPTSDLDHDNRAAVVGALRELAGTGVLVVMTTHDPEAAAGAGAELALSDGSAAWVRGAAT